MKDKNVAVDKKELSLRFALLVIGMIFISIGTTFILKAGLGQSSVSSLSKNLEFVTGIKAGTIIAIINYICFFIQIIMLKKEFKISQVFQLVATTVFGSMVNFFSYSLPITANIDPDKYIFKMILLLVGICLSTFGVSSMTKADLVFMPFEGFCNAVVYKSGKPFSTVRPIIDAIIVFVSFIVLVIFNIPNTAIREGTIICTLLFGKFVGMYNKYVFKTEK